MVNLLPEAGYENVVRQYRLRLITIAVVLLAVVGIVGIVGMLPSYFLSQVRAAAVEDQVDLIERAIEHQERNNVAAELAAAKAELSVINRGLDTMSLAGLLDIALGAAEGVSLTSFTLTHPEAGTGVLALSGTAPNREALTTFADRLRQEERFEQVELPIGNLARDRDLTFTITVTGSF